MRHCSGISHRLPAIQRLRAENGRLIHLQDNSSQDAAQVSAHPLTTLHAHQTSNQHCKAAGRLAALQNAMDELRQAGEAALRSNVELRRENDSLALKNCELAAAGVASRVNFDMCCNSWSFRSRGGVGRTLAVAMCAA